jgi:TetR/AcrR family transcriptional regulator, regulator of autoinduction and epiphytic fitness
LPKDSAGWLTSGTTSKLTSMTEVKGEGTSRQLRARRTRLRMLEAARDLLIEHGYTPTTMDRIAERAGVAVQTVYYTFGTKGRLLCEVVQSTAAHQEDPVLVAQRPWMQELLSSNDGQRVLSLAVAHGTDIYERAAPLWPAITSAVAVDQDVEQYWLQVAAGRRAGQARMVAHLAEIDHLRQDLDVARATDLVVVLFGHDVYRGLVTDAGWSVPSFKQWLFTTLVRQLLDVAPDHAAHADLFP